MTTPVFLDFAQRQFRCLDYDPFHAFLLHLEKDRSPEEGLWASFLYMAFYSDASAWWVASTTKPLEIPSPDVDRYHIGEQRRNLRASSVHKHILSFIDHASAYDSIHEFLTDGFTDDPRHNWDVLLARLGTVWGNGRWGAYTSAEVFQKVNHLPVEPTSLGLEGATGPRAGLLRLMGTQGTPQPPASLLEAYGASVRASLATLDLSAVWYAPRLDYAMTESVLCDYNSLAKGRYYIGRDIDRQHGRIEAMRDRLPPSLFRPLYQARVACFAPPYLGEHQGRAPGIDHARCQLYARHGVLADYQDDAL